MTRLLTLLAATFVFAAVAAPVLFQASKIVA
jgi:hypothetical protein